MAGRVRKVGREYVKMILRKDGRSSDWLVSHKCITKCYRIWSRNMGAGKKQRN